MQGNRLLRGMSLALLISFGLFVVVGCRTNLRTESKDIITEPEATLDNSQVADMQMALGRTMETRGQGQEAMTVYEEAVKKDPRRADVWVRLAVLSDKEAMFANSGEYYQKALALEPLNADTHCNRGYSLYLQNRMSEAETALRRAIELSPEHHRALNNLGLVLAQTGRRSESLEAFRRAGSTPTDAHVNLAYGLVLQGSLGEAREEYERALALDPTSAVARKGLAELSAVSPKTVELTSPKVMPDSSLVPIPVFGDVVP